MSYSKQLARLFRIYHTLLKNGLDEMTRSFRLPIPWRFVFYLNPYRWGKKKNVSRGEAICRALEDLGPIFVKFGQALSTRPDILPDDVSSALRRLQNAVKPFDGDEVLAIIQKTFGLSAYELFDDFDPNPLASASIAQVHQATLKTGEQVVVKVLRPGVHAKINSDLQILKTIARMADKYWIESKRFKPKEIVQEFEKNLMDELDLFREAANGSQLRRNFKSSPLLYIPKIYWDYVRENIMVMEFIEGIPVSDIATLKKQGVNLKKLAERGVEIFFTQVFRDCFFHADMHPGNIFVSYQHPENPQYLCVDFGIIGTLTDKDQRYLAENLLAFFKRDYRRVARLHIETGWVGRDTRENEFENAIRTVCEPIFERPLKDISFALVILRLFQVARRFDMVVQPQLILLQKTLFAIEGLGRQIYPDLNLWDTAKPFLEKWIKKQYSPAAFIHNVRENIPFVIEQLPQMPKLINEVLLQLKDQKKCIMFDKRSQKRKKSHDWWYGLGVGFVGSLIFWVSLQYLLKYCC